MPQSFAKTQTVNTQSSLIQSGCCILSYVCEILHILKQSNVKINSNLSTINSLASIDATVLDDFERYFHHNFLTDLNNDTLRGNDILGFITKWDDVLLRFDQIKLPTEDQLLLLLERQIVNSASFKIQYTLFQNEKQ